MISPLITRRAFLQTTAFLAATASGVPAWASDKKDPLLAFSTLGCPDWSLEQIVKFAAAHGFKGIEVRGLLRHMDLPTCKEFSNENRAGSLRLMDDNGLRFINLGSSASMHHADETARRKNLDEGKRYIDLAAQLKCPFIRVFPNNFPEGQDKAFTLDLIARGLLELGDYAKGSNVKVLMESHGDLLYTADLAQVMKASEHPHVGLVWDMTNMWVKTKELPARAYGELKKYIHHTHIKNARLENDKIKYTRIAEGEVPIFEMIESLHKGGYNGYYSFEWEKMWHPELEAPELAIADYAVVMKRYFEKK
jgi:sugar phosphate isomerase/epimerase